MDENSCINLKKIFKSCQFIFTTVLLSPFRKKVVALHMNKIEFLSRWFVQYFGWNWPSNSQEEEKLKKVYENATTLVSGELKTHSKVNE